MQRAGFKKADDFLDTILHRYGAGWAMSYEFIGNGRHGQHKIDLARGNRATRHAIVIRFHRILRNYQPASSLDRGEANRAIGTSARKDHANGPFSYCLCQGFQKKIKWQPGTMACQRHGKLKFARLKRQINARWNYVEVIDFNQHAIRRLEHRHRRNIAKQLRHHAWMIWIKMLHENKGHPRFGR